MTTEVIYLEDPDKSKADKKLYKTLRLTNGLTALIISDPTPVPHDGFTTSESSMDEDSCGDGDSEKSKSCSTDSSSQSSSTSSDTEDSSDSDMEEGDEKLAACAVLIDYGSFAEPLEYQGLAHFLEHMIFMGSSKYPSENAFDAYIKKCGGSNNACTDSEETLFYFEVAEEYLDTSLDYFTALLKDPLMKKEAMQRERYAVESEFQQIVQDDESRRDQLLGSLASEEFPHSTFAWGNLKSLKDNVDDEELHSVLHDVRKKHYGANRMYICMQARLPIDELETLVLRHFKDIPTTEFKSPDLKLLDYRKAFRPEFYELAYFMKPVENEIRLELTWVLPPVMKYYRCKPDHFISHLLGYEGYGSLCAYLHRRLWGIQLWAGVEENGFDNNSMYSLFNICIDLTDEGLKHLDDVIAATFAYIKLFANCGSLSALYAEQQNIEDINFRYEPQRPAADNVQDLVTCVKYYPPKDILTGSNLYYEFNESQLLELIGHLNEFKFNIMLTSKECYEGLSFDKKEKWFGTEYATTAMPEKWKRLWDESKPMEELFLPHANRFVPNDFRLFWSDFGKPDVPVYPKKLLQTDTCELWYRMDDKFELPEAMMNFHFISPLQRETVKNDTLCSLYEQLVYFEVNEELYPAVAAGLSYSLYATEKGLILKISGFNEKLHLIVEAIAQAMITVQKTLTEDIMETFRQKQSKSYFNMLIKPRALNRDIRLCVLEHIRWPLIDKYKCLNNITFADLSEFAKKFPEELYIKALIQGNYTEESAHNVMNSVLTRLNCKPIRNRQLIEDRTVQLPQGAHYIRCHALNDQDTNSVVTNFYQIGPITTRIESILDLLIMFVEEPLFDHLRTKEQLGYHVSAAVRIIYGIIGYSIKVNSQETKTTASHVEERIEVFRGKMLEILDEMSDEDYDHARESLIKLKQMADMSLSSEVKRNWDEIFNDDYLFDRRRKQVEILRTLAKSDIVSFLLENERSNMRKLSVQVIGYKPDTSFITKKMIGNRDCGCGSEPDMDCVDEILNESTDPEVDDALFYELADKLNVVFIPQEGDATTIVDIDEFKENLDMYPTPKQDNDPVALSRPARIEDALGNA